MPIAFSYIRFSSVKQELGDSLRRQQRKAEEYAAKHNLQLDTQTYQDLGISAFRGQNAAQGNLSKFLEAVESGKIPWGSFLLVESLDRLSRNDVDVARQMFLRIIGAGITVVTLVDEQSYSSEKIKVDRGLSLIISITLMSRANEESATKSYRIRQAWEAKRARGEILTGMGPAWLTLSADRKHWVVNAGKARVVRRVFNLALAGHGAPSIARVLNSENVETMGNSRQWTYGTVGALLRNPAVFGLYTPKKSVKADPIPGYYPSIIDETLYRLVQAGMVKRRWAGGRGAQLATNIFSTLALCALCEEKMRVVGTSGRHSYIRCLGAYSNSGCPGKRFPYRAAEIAATRFLADDMSQELTVDDKQEDPTVSLKAQELHIQQRLAKLLEVAESAPDSKGIAAQIIKVESQIEAITAKLRSLGAPASEFDNQAMSELFERLKSWDGPLEPDLRLRVQMQMRQMVEKIYFHTDEVDGKQAIAMKMSERFGGHYMFLDLTPYREQVGGNRSGHDEKRRRRLGKAMPS
jgi:DNA invertase Pin-like site-specific DNA recombinase